MARAARETAVCVPLGVHLTRVLLRKISTSVFVLSFYLLLNRLLRAVASTHIPVGTLGFAPRMERLFFLLSDWVLRVPVGL